MDKQDKKPRARAFYDRADRTNMVMAHRSINKDGNYTVIAGPGSNTKYNNADRDAAKFNADNKTAFQGKNLQKIKSSNFGEDKRGEGGKDGRVRAHMMRDSESGKTFGSKPKMSRFESGKATKSFHKANDFTQKDSQTGLQKPSNGQKSQSGQPKGAFGGKTSAAKDNPPALNGAQSAKSSFPNKSDTAKGASSTKSPSQSKGAFTGKSPSSSSAKAPTAAFGKSGGNGKGGASGGGASKGSGGSSGGASKSSGSGGGKSK